MNNMYVSVRRWLVSCLAAALASCVALSAIAQQVPPAGGVAIGVPTEDAAGNGMVLGGMLWLPQGPPRAAVVFANGSGGWRDWREGYYGRTLAAAGYAALAIDSFGARGIADTAADQSQISIIQMARDTFSGRRFLIAQGLAPNRIGIMGWSRGGGVVLAAADRTYLHSETDRFQVAIAFYPSCNFRPRLPKPASVMFVALGERDDYTGVKPCQDIADDYAKAGAKITIKVYPNSGHQFDGNPDDTRRRRDFMAETYIDCVAYVEEDGAATSDGKRFDPEASPILCVTFVSSPMWAEGPRCGPT
jgi:dienelactone hydrolase